MNLVFPQRDGSVVSQWNGIESLDKLVVSVPYAIGSPSYILASAKVDNHFLLICLTL